MTPETLTALKASIAHWRANVAATEPGEADTGSASCALCLKFNAWLRGGFNCTGCPVVDRTGRHGCIGSPHQAADEALDEWLADESDANEQAFRAAAQAELDFLISLLPEGEAP